MRRTLTGIGALSLTVALAYCQNDNPGSSQDLATTNRDMSASVEDLSGTTQDLTGTTQDLTGTTQDLTATGDMAPAAAPTEFSVLRIGTGTGTLTNNGTAGFVERRKVTDGSLVSTVTLPTAVSGTNNQIVFSGVASVEGQLNRSFDGKTLLVAGTAANVGATDVSSTALTRVVAVISATGTVNTARTFALGTSAPRGVTSTNGNAVWVTSDAGVSYMEVDKPAVTPVKVVDNNLRAAGLYPYNNVTQLLASSFASSGTDLRGINLIGAGTPTTVLTNGATRLSGFTGTNSPASYDFVAFDRDNNGTVDQMYVADERATGGGVQRWKLTGTTWSLDGTVALGATPGARCVTGFVSGTTVTLLATTTESNATRIMKLTDNGGAVTAITQATLYTGPANTIHRGIALAPLP